MAKKLIVILVIGLVAVASVFASHSISATVAPYSFQKIAYSPKDHIDSTYGWGGQAGYRYTIGNVLKVGADLSFTSYKINGYSKYLSLSLIAKGGLVLNMTKKIYMYMDTGVGVDFRIGEKVSGFYPVLGAGFSVGYVINEKVSVICGSDFSLTFQKNKDGSLFSRDFDVTPRLGAEINL